MKTYKYLAFDRVRVQQYFDAETPPDSYVSSDSFSKALESALNEGYRWVRSEGNEAIFELVLDNVYEVLS
jgi:hypothetical protein